MGLELGGDDYLAKPYSIRELVLRVKNLFSRAYSNNNIKLQEKVKISVSFLLSSSITIG